MSEREAFERDLARPDYHSGVIRGHWRLIAFDWPSALFFIAAPARPGAPALYALHLQLDGYPDLAPIGIFWDPLRGTILDATRWPKRSDEEHVQVFRIDWKPPNQGTSLYVPADRTAIDSHPEWGNRADFGWKANPVFTTYLRCIHSYLDSERYTGIRGA